MTQTPDRFPGSLGEEEVILEEQTEDPSAEGGVRYVSGAFRAKDSSGVFNLRTGSSFDLNNCVFDVSGCLVYGNDELIVTRV